MRAAPAYAAPKHVVAIALVDRRAHRAARDLREDPGALSPRRLLVAQHMPDKFTRTFAERLDRKGAMRVTEAQDGDSSRRSTRLRLPRPAVHGARREPPALRATASRIAAPAADDRYVPSADRLLRSVAAAAGAARDRRHPHGHGRRRRRGARGIRDAGGIVIAESEETAVVYGMPGAAVRAGLATETLPLPQIAEYIASLR